MMAETPPVSNDPSLAHGEQDPEEVLTPEDAQEQGQDADRFRRAALKRGAQRRAQFQQSIEEAIRTIAKEMAANGGIYPSNGGAVSIKEVARRAGVNESTLFKKDNAAIKQRIELWIDTLKKKETVGRMRVRRAYKERAEDWRQKYLALESQHIAQALTLQQMEAQNLKLKQDNEALLAELSKQSAGKVKALPLPGER
jgi:hypothetical protein